MRDQILYYALLYHGDWNRIAKAISLNEQWRKIDYRGCYLTIADDGYPQCFRRLRYPPWILFYKGNMDLLNHKAVSVIGSRKASTEGKKAAQEIVDILKKKYVIISGLAKGIDAQVHHSALDRMTVGIIGCGIDRVYPAENVLLYEKMEQQHLIVSEYPGDTRPFAAHFPWRNRLIAAAGEALIVVEATVRSGTMHTVNQALELSRPVYCATRSFTEKIYTGNALLIQQGAQMLLNREDVEEL